MKLGFNKRIKTIAMRLNRQRKYDPMIGYLLAQRPTNSNTLVHVPVNMVN